MSAPSPGQHGGAAILNSYGAQWFQKHWPPVLLLWYPWPWPFGLSWLAQVTLVHGLSLSSPITVWHCSLSCRVRSPEDGSQLQRQILWAGNGNKLSRQDASPTGPVNLRTHYPRKFKISSNISILFWYHHHDRFKWVSHLHILCMNMYTQIGWWVIWETLPRFFKLGLLFLHEK